MVSNRGSSLRGGAAGGGIGRQRACPPAHRGTIGVALHQRLDHLRQPKPGLACRGSNRGIRLGAPELLVVGEQLLDALGQSLLLRTGHGSAFRSRRYLTQTGRPPSRLPDHECDRRHTQARGAGE